MNRKSSVNLQDQIRTQLWSVQSSIDPSRSHSNWSRLSKKDREIVEQRCSCPLSFMEEGQLCALLGQSIVMRIDAELFHKAALWEEPQWEHKKRYHCRQWRWSTTFDVNFNLYVYFCSFEQEIITWTIVTRSDITVNFVLSETSMIGTRSSSQSRSLFSWSGWRSIFDEFYSHLHRQKWRIVHCS